MDDNFEPRFVLVGSDRLAASLVDIWASCMAEMEEESLLVEAARSIAVKMRAETLAHKRMSLNVLDIMPMADLEAALVRRGRIVIPEDWADEYKDFGPAPAQRNELGHWFHPGFPWPLVAAEASFEPLLEAMGLEGTAVYMQHDKPELYEHRYSEQDSLDCSYWEPAKPVGPEWFLLCITDTEDGPAATFVRRAAKGLNPGAAWPFPGQV